MITYSRTVDYATGERETIVVGVGTTMYVATVTERVMSDVWEPCTYAYYWDTDNKKIGAVSINYYGMNQADRPEYTIDANDMDTILKEYREMRYKMHIVYELQREEEAAHRPYIKGREVKVVRGRTSKGAVGKVVVAMERQYGMGYRTSNEYKLGIALDDEMTTYVAKNGKTYPTHKNMIWVWARNCEVVAPEVNVAEAEHRAKSKSDYDVAGLLTNIKNCESRRYRTVSAT